MPIIVSVKFHFASRDLWFDPQESAAAAGDFVICQTERGVEFGLVTQGPFELPEEEVRGIIGEKPLQPVLRRATDEDISYAESLTERAEDAFAVFRRHVANLELDMKPVGVEYLFDGEKVVCYFSADERVDFRQLVRDMSHELHMRVDMRQIGVREEAALIGGFGHCGQELCCRRFSSSFDPVSIRMAKEQDLPLNSTKISGACGRLMCCLRYEFEAYRDFKSRAPKRNATIQTPLGVAKIVEYNTPKELLTLRLENGKQIRVPLADMDCSDEACKKAEEHGCHCRPDSVSRSVLERLESPEVQMALAELDKLTGIAPDPQMSEWVAPDYAERKVQHASEDATPTRQLRRRRRSATESDESEKAAPRSPRQGKDVTRHARPERDEQEQSQRVSRRRHRTHDASHITDASTPERTAPVRRTRRPGDKGGRSAPQHFSADTSSASQRERRRRTTTTDEGEHTPSREPGMRRRRAHRSGEETSR